MLKVIAIKIKQTGKSFNKYFFYIFTVIPLSLHLYFILIISDSFLYNSFIIINLSSYLRVFEITHLRNA